MKTEEIQKIREEDLKKLVKSPIRPMELLGKEPMQSRKKLKNLRTR